VADDGKDLGGLHYKSGKTEISASENAIEGALEHAEHVWFGTLDWAAEHPILAIPLFGLVVLIVVLRYLTKKDERKQKGEYQRWRDTVPIQPPLPLPPPGENPTSLPPSQHQEGHDE